MTAAHQMRLVIVSGLSGSGKSIALHMLEDLDYYCVDNLPVGLLRAFVDHTVAGALPLYTRTAVGVPHSASEIFPATATRTSISARFTDPASTVGTAHARPPAESAASASAQRHGLQPIPHPTLRL